MREQEVPHLSPASALQTDHSSPSGLARLSARFRGEDFVLFLRISTENTTTAAFIVCALFMPVMGSHASKSKKKTDICSGASNPSGRQKEPTPKRREVLPRSVRSAQQHSKSVPAVCPSWEEMEQELQQHLLDMHLELTLVRTGSGLSFSSAPPSRSQSPQRHPSMHLVRPSSLGLCSMSSRSALTNHLRLASVVSTGSSGSSSDSRNDDCCDSKTSVDGVPSSMSYDLLSMRTRPLPRLASSPMQGKHPWIIEDMDTRKKYRVWGPDEYGLSLKGGPDSQASDDMFVEELDSSPPSMQDSSSMPFFFSQSSRSRYRTACVGSVEVREVLSGDSVSKPLALSSSAMHHGADRGAGPQTVQGRRSKVPASDEQPTRRVSWHMQTFESTVVFHDADSPKAVGACRRSVSPA